MSRRAWFGGFGAGLLAGAIGAALLLGGREGTKARAQGGADPTQVGRYQLMTWSLPGSTSNKADVTPPSFGAYVLDTASGHLWRTMDRGGLEMVGRGKRAQD